MTTVYTQMDSPIGRLTLTGVVHSGATMLIGLYFSTGKQALHAPLSDWSESAAALSEARQQLEQYFAGERRGFELALAPSGTPFQKQVLAGLQQIPFGETCSYGELARQIGRPKAVRAVGGANARNPIAIIIPCHRVIGTGGKLTGFGGGIDAKRYLLDFEAEQGGQASA